MLSCLLLGVCCQVPVNCGMLLIVVRGRVLPVVCFFVVVGCCLWLLIERCALSVAVCRCSLCVLMFCVV